MFGAILFRATLNMSRRRVELHVSCRTLVTLGSTKKPSKEAELVCSSGFLSSKEQRRKIRIREARSMFGKSYALQDRGACHRNDTWKRAPLPPRPTPAATSVVVFHPSHRDDDSPREMIPDPLAISPPGEPKINPSLIDAHEKGGEGDKTNPNLDWFVQTDESRIQPIVRATPAQQASQGVPRQQMIRPAQSGSASAKANGGLRPIRRVF